MNLMAGASPVVSTIEHPLAELNDFDDLMPLTPSLWSEVLEDHSGKSGVLPDPHYVRSLPGGFNRRGPLGQSHIIFLIHTTFTPSHMASTIEDHSGGTLTL